MRSRVSVLVIFLCYSALGQIRYSWPIDKVVLTGNYGEVRPNHFHAGIDFSTEGEENFPIYSVADGNVVRIKVSPYGYGKVLYIAHHDGKMSVYAHQNRFNDKISAYVRNEQIQKQTFDLELFPKPGELSVKRGEIIGYSGNTGGSTGPHLHFEIRDDLTEIPVNPMFYFDVIDSVKPAIDAVSFYDLKDSLRDLFMNSYKVKAKGDSLFLANDSLILKGSILGLAFLGNDRMIAKGNPNNIYDVSLFLDSVCIYRHQLNYISFDNASYVNQYSDIVNKQKFQKCFVPKLYPKDMYKRLSDKGRIHLMDTLFHTVKLLMKDEFGNENILSFFVKTRQFTSYKTIDAKGEFFINCTETFTFSGKSYHLEIPARSLFNDAFFVVKNNLDLNNTIMLGQQDIKFRTPANLKIKLNKKLAADSGRVILRHNNSAIIPKYKNGYAEFSIKSFGSFQLTRDTIKPGIKTKTPLKRLKKIFPKAEHLTFVIKDNLSGIAAYKLFINDKWYLAEYDAKSDLLTYFFDNETPTGELNVRVEVSDRVGNTAQYKLKLKR